MLAMDAALISHFASGKPYREETFVWIVGRNTGTNAEEPFGLWTGDNTLTFTVFDPRLQANAARSYIGSGSIETVPVIIGSPNLLTQNAVTFEFSTVVSGVRDLIRGKNLRYAHVEVHQGYFDAATDALIANPMLVYIGVVDVAAENEEGISLEGEETRPATIAVSFIPHIRTFKKNTKTRSLATSLERSGDIFYKWANVVANWKIWWGRRNKGHKDNKGGGNKGTGDSSSSFPKNNDR